MVGKFDLYDESAGVPLIMAGPDVPAGRGRNARLARRPLPTVLEAVGLERNVEEREFPGQSLWQIAAAPDQERTVLSEYHAFASQHGMFMLRNRRSSTSTMSTTGLSCST